LAKEQPVEKLFYTEEYAALKPIIQQCALMGCAHCSPLTSIRKMQLYTKIWCSKAGWTDDSNTALALRASRGKKLWKNYSYTEVYAALKSIIIIIYLPTSSTDSSKYRTALVAGQEGSELH